jgi:hypothetical protein
MPMLIILLLLLLLRDRIGVRTTLNLFLFDVVTLANTFSHSQTVSPPSPHHPHHIFLCSILLRSTCSTNSLTISSRQSNQSLSASRSSFGSVSFNSKHLACTLSLNVDACSALLVV